MTARSFFIVGTAKAGTTTIHRSLSRQPGVVLTTPKETWYFDGPQYSSTDPRGDFLRRFVPRHAGALAYGEVATSYLFAPHAPDRIHRAFPDARIVAILRNPVDRAYSDWWMLHSAGFDDLAFDAAIDENLGRLSQGVSFEGTAGRDRWYAHLETLRCQRRVLYRTYVDYGYYGEQLARWRECYPDSQLEILLFEELFSGQETYAAQMQMALGLDDLVLQTGAHANPAFRSKALRRLVGVAARLPLARLVPRALRVGLVRVLSSVGQAPRIDTTIRQRLIEHYEPHLGSLEQFLGRDLSLWRRQRGPA